MTHPGNDFPSPGGCPFGRLVAPRYPSIPDFVTHALVEVGRDFPFPQSRAIGSRSLNAIVMQYA